MVDTNKTKVTYTYAGKALAVDARNAGLRFSVKSLHLSAAKQTLTIKSERLENVFKILPVHTAKKAGISLQVNFLDNSDDDYSVVAAALVLDDPDQTVFAFIESAAEEFLLTKSKTSSLFVPLNIEWAGKLNEKADLSVNFAAAPATEGAYGTVRYATEKEMADGRRGVVPTAARLRQLLENVFGLGSAPALTKVASPTYDEKTFKSEEANDFNQVKRTCFFKFFKAAKNSPQEGMQGVCLTIYSNDNTVQLAFDRAKLKMFVRNCSYSGYYKPNWTKWYQIPFLDDGAFQQGVLTPFLQSTDSTRIVRAGDQDVLTRAAHGGIDVNADAALVIDATADKRVRRKLEFDGTAHQRQVAIGAEKRLRIYVDDGQYTFDGKGLELPDGRVFSEGNRPTVGDVDGLEARLYSRVECKTLFDYRIEKYYISNHAFVVSYLFDGKIRRGDVTAIRPKSKVKLSFSMSSVLPISSEFTKPFAHLEFLMTKGDFLRKSHKEHAYSDAGEVVSTEFSTALVPLPPPGCQQRSVLNFTPSLYPKPRNFADFWLEIDYRDSSEIHLLVQSRKVLDSNSVTNVVLNRGSPIDLSGKTRLYDQDQRIAILSIKLKTG